MSRRHALANLSRDFCRLSTLFLSSSVLLQATAHWQPLYYQPLPHSFLPRAHARGACNVGGVFSYSDPPQITDHEPVTSLECALTSQLRVLPVFGRNCRPVSPLKCALAKRGPRNLFRMRSYEKTGGRDRLSLTRWLENLKNQGWATATVSFGNQRIRGPVSGKGSPYGSGQCTVHSFRTISR